jgi:hypothetical protein
MNSPSNKSQRPKAIAQPAPDELVQRLMRKIRSQFCAGLDDNTWFRAHYHFIKRNVILWPARKICSEHGFTLPADRYEKIGLTILEDIRQNREAPVIQFWPAYLMKCVQSHWLHHWEEYYAEAKSLRELTARALLALGSLEKREERSVESLALAHQVLAASRKARKKTGSKTQLSLFGDSEK